MELLVPISTTNLIDGLIRSNEELLDYVIDGDPQVSLQNSI